MLKRYVNWVATTKWPQTKSNRTLAATEPQAFARHIALDFLGAAVLYGFMKYQQNEMKKRHNTRVMDNIHFGYEQSARREEDSYAQGLSDGAHTLYDQIRADSDDYIVTTAATAAMNKIRPIIGENPIIVTEDDPSSLTDALRAQRFETRTDLAGDEYKVPNPDYRR